MTYSIPDSKDAGEAAESIKHQLESTGLWWSLKEWGCEDKIRLSEIHHTVEECLGSLALLHILQDSVQREEREMVVIAPSINNKGNLRYFFIRKSSYEKFDICFHDQHRIFDDWETFLNSEQINPEESYGIFAKIQQPRHELVPFSHHSQANGWEEEFYYYSTEDRTEAPFHHLRQHGIGTSENCGYNALAAFIGYDCPGYGMETFIKFLETSCYKTPNEKLHTKAKIYRQNEEAPEKKSLNGVYVHDIHLFLEQQSEIKTHYIILSQLFAGHHLFPGLSIPQILEIEISATDRFIFACAKYSHAITFRKDTKGLWWEINGRKNYQKGSTKEQLIKYLVDLYEEEYGCLEFVFPGEAPKIH